MVDSGALSSRYARTLLAFSEERNVSEKVYGDALLLIEVLRNHGDIQHSLGSVSEEMSRFIALVVSHGRAKFLLQMLITFTRLYRHKNGITDAHLTSARKDAELEEKLKAIFRERGYTKLNFESKVDEKLVGGFILQVDDIRLDASLARGLKEIKKEFEEKNRNLL